MVKEQCVGIDGKPLRVVKKEAGYLYFVNTDGSVMRAKMEGKAPLSPEEIKKRAKAKAEKTAKYQARIAANREKKIEKLEAAQKSAKEKEARRMEKIRELKD